MKNNYLIHIEENQYDGLIFECPFKTEKSYCPFIKIRSMEVKERLEYYYNKCSNNDRRFLIQFHQKCLHERESKSNYLLEKYFIKV